jgi:putative transposase
VIHELPTLRIPFHKRTDQENHSLDSRISEKRDMDAAKKFFEQALAVVGHARGAGDDRRALVLSSCNTYLNNLLEQDHRGIKQRYDPMRGFGNVASAVRFCRAFDELRQYFRSRRTTKEYVSLAQQRRLFLTRLAVLQELISFSR